MAFDIRLCPNRANDPPRLHLGEADMISMTIMNAFWFFELVKMSNQNLIWHSFLQVNPHCVGQEKLH